MFLSEIFASQALHLRLRLNGFIKCLNLEIQMQCVTFRCYPEDFGILIGRPEGEWRNLSHLLRKHLPKVAEQVCGSKRTSTLDYFGLDFPSLSCPLSFAFTFSFTNVPNWFYHLSWGIDPASGSAASLCLLTCPPHRESQD